MVCRVRDWTTLQGQAIEIGENNGMMIRGVRADDMVKSARSGKVTLFAILRLHLLNYERPFVSVQK